MNFASQLGIGLGTALVSAAVMLWLWPWWLCLTALGLIAVHEAGHYLAAKYLGLDPYVPYFIPLGVFLLGATTMAKHPDEIQWMAVALAGPVAGLAGAGVVLGVSLFVGSLPGILVGTVFTAGEIFNLTAGPDSAKIRRGYRRIRATH